MKKLIRNAHIGLAVCVAIYVIGLIVFHGNEAAMDVVGGAGPVACFAVYLGLNVRDDRAWAQKVDDRSHWLAKGGREPSRRADTQSRDAN